MEIGKVQATNFGMAYRKITSPKEVRAKFLNSLSTDELSNLNKDMKKAIDALKSTVYAHLYSVLYEDENKLYNFIEYSKPEFNKENGLTYVASQRATSDNFDEAINDTLDMDQELSQKVNAIDETISILKEKDE